MTTLITNSQFKQFDADGKPLAGGKIYTYIVGTVGTATKKATYQDQDKEAAHENPITLDSWGEQEIWIDGDTKLVVTDSDDVVIRTYPSYSDSGTGTSETPVISSPDDAVLRSITTEIGYIKIQLPMGEWPNTKMMFDVSIFENELNAVKLNLAGFANSTTEQWEDASAVTNGALDYAVQFGNDGTYPCVYIGEVDSEWEKPQIAVSNFFAGQFEYDYSSFDDGWDISITTSLGTITDTPTLIKKYLLASDEEVQDGEEDEKIVTPAGLSARTATESRTGVVALATEEEVETGEDTEKAVTSAGVKGVADRIDDDIDDIIDSITITDWSTLSSAYMFNGWSGYLYYRINYASQHIDFYTNSLSKDSATSGKFAEIDTLVPTGYSIPDIIMVYTGYGRTEDDPLKITLINGDDLSCDGYALITTSVYLEFNFSVPLTKD